MVIYSNSFDDLPDMYMLGFYHPADFAYDGDGCKFPQNPDFNDFSSIILELKNENNEDYEKAIDHFLCHLSKILSRVEDILIVTPPTKSGIKDLAERLAYENNMFVNLTGCKNNEGLINLSENNSIIGKKVILLDDVVTSGKTMRSCKSELLRLGVTKVKCIALGRTYRDIKLAHDLIEKEYCLELEKEQEKLLPSLVNIADNLQKNVSVLKNIKLCNQDDFFTINEVANSMKAEIQEIEGLEVCIMMKDDDLCRDKKEAFAVLKGDAIFSCRNIFQKLFLW